MKYLFVIWLSENPIEKVFTSLRIILWSNVLNKLLDQSKNAFLMMFDTDRNHSFMEFIHKLNIMKDEEQYFLEISTNDQQEMMENILKTSKFISFDHDNQLMINIEHVDNDYLLKSSKDSSSK
jgi:hypothetical protein